MSNLSKKAAEVFRFRLPDKAAMAKMTESERRKLKSDYLAAIPSQEVVAQMNPEDRQAVIDQVMQAAAAMPGPKLAEPMPAGGQPVRVAHGLFQKGEGKDTGSGQALIYRFPDDRIVLRFEEFSVSNGPALHVLLASSASPTNKTNLGNTIDLGPLKSDHGDQNYEIPIGTDLGRYRCVVIFCVMYSVVISPAPLK